jgi:hypothetical protein
VSKAPAKTHFGVYGDMGDDIPRFSRQRYAVMMVAAALCLIRLYQPGG